LANNVVSYFEGSKFHAVSFGALKQKLQKTCRRRIGTVVFNASRMSSTWTKATVWERRCRIRCKRIAWRTAS
jgi:hypothetical protein